MATQTHVTLVDDIDGSSATETVAFGLDGAYYEIDLNDKNAKKLRDAVANFVANGRHVGPRATRTRVPKSRVAARSGNSKEQLSAIRDWARKNGYEVSDRGRLSRAVVEAFDAAH